MFQKVVDSRQNGLRILETLECGHVIDSVTQSEEVDCIACDIEFVAATPERVLKRIGSLTGRTNWTANNSG